MLSTILSENQYETKFVATANMKPKSRPCAPPRASPIHMSRALRTPSSNAVFATLDMNGFSWQPRSRGRRASHGSILQSREQSRNERRPERQRFDLYMLV